MSFGAMWCRTDRAELCHITAKGRNCSETAAGRCGCTVCLSHCRSSKAIKAAKRCQSAAQSEREDTLWWRGQNGNGGAAFGLLQSHSLCPALAVPLHVAKRAKPGLDADAAWLSPAGCTPHLELEQQCASPQYHQQQHSCITMSFHPSPSYTNKKHPEALRILIGDRYVP